MKKKLYLITSDFPYGNGENSFLIPELPYLKEKFDITIISNSLSKEQTYWPKDNIRVVHYERKASFLEKIWDSICYFGSKDAYLEIGDILRSRKNFFRCFLESVLFFEEARRFERFLKKNSIIDVSEPAVIYTYWFTYYCYTMLRLFGKNANIKVITRTHRYDLYDEGYLGDRQPFKRQMNKQIDGIVFIAEHGLNYYLNKYGQGLKEKCHLFRLGVKPIGEQTEKSGRQNDVFLLVSCSMVNSRKRVELIVDALAHIVDINIKWVHFGDGCDFEELKQRTEKKLGAMQNIEYSLRGYVDSSKIMEYYERHYVDAFITTTASEGCPVSIQEAMAYGIPIIGTAVAEIPYMIQGNGILLKEDPTEEEIAEAIRKIYSLEEREKQLMRERSYQLWRQYFNADMNASRFVAYLCDEVDL